MGLRQHQRRARNFAIPTGSSLILLTAICAALLSAEPPIGRQALRHFESQVVKAKTILHHLSAVSPAKDSTQIRVLVEGLLEIQPLALAKPAVAKPFPAPERASSGRLAAPALFQRPPPHPAAV